MEENEERQKWWSETIMEDYQEKILNTLKSIDETLKRIEEKTNNEYSELLVNSINKSIYESKRPTSH